jgi:hypothetical protein
MCVDVSTDMTGKKGVCGGKSLRQNGSTHGKHAQDLELCTEATCRTWIRPVCV